MSIEIYEEPDDSEIVSLEALAEIVRTNIAQANDALAAFRTTWLDRMAPAGRALLEARKIVQRGKWMEFLQLCRINPGTAQKVMYAALNENELRAIDATEADQLWQLESGREIGRIDALTPEEIELAQQMHSDGETYHAIARSLGRSHGLIRKAIIPGERERVALRAKELERRRNERLRQARADARDLADMKRRQERDQLAKATGGDLEKAYGQVRIAQQAIGKYLGATSTQAPERQRITNAASHLRSAENELTAAMRVLRVDPSVARMVADE